MIFPVGKSQEVIEEDPSYLNAVEVPEVLASGTAPEISE